MQQWEYLFISMRSVGNRQMLVGATGVDAERYKGTFDDTLIEDQVNRIGGDGWEMVNCGTARAERIFHPTGYFSAVFKRPKA